MKLPIYRLAAVAFALWGLLHAVLGSIFLALSLWGPADAFAADGIPADTSAHARALMMQNNVSLIAAGVTVFVLAIRLGWRGSRPAFGVMLGVSTLFFFEFVAFEVIPGHLTLGQAAPSIVAWIVAAVLGVGTLARVGSGGQRSDPA